MSLEKTQHFIKYNKETDSYNFSIDGNQFELNNDLNMVHGNDKDFEVHISHSGNAVVFAINDENYTISMATLDNLKSGKYKASTLTLMTMD